MTKNENTVPQQDQTTVEETEVTDNTNVIEELQSIIEKKNEELEQANDKYMRLVAEYDNFKKRTVKEKDALYTNSVCDIVKEVLPIADNLERAMNSFEDKESEHYKGFEMVLRQTMDIFTKLGVEQIKAEGESFNPELHNAVMHIDDENFDENTVAEEFAKGYIYKDRVIRHSMVKVAN